MKIQTQTKEKTQLKFLTDQLLDLTIFLVILFHHSLWDLCIYYFSLAQEDGPKSMKNKKSPGDEISMRFEIFTYIKHMHLYYLSFMYII